jgi:hypothetical protein
MGLKAQAVDARKAARRLCRPLYRALSLRERAVSIFSFQTASSFPHSFNRVRTASVSPSSRIILGYVLGVNGIRMRIFVHHLCATLHMRLLCWFHNVSQYPPKTVLARLDLRWIHCSKWINPLHRRYWQIENDRNPWIMDDSCTIPAKLLFPVRG